MTAYSVLNVNSGYMAIYPNTYEIRVPLIEFQAFYYDTSSSGIPSTLTGGIWVGTAVSSGSAYTPVPLRQGSPTSTATAKVGYTSSVPTNQLANYITTLYDSAANFTYQPPFDTIIQPGSMLLIEWNFPTTGGTAFAGGGVTVFYEELRLSWHF